MVANTEIDPIYNELAARFDVNPLYEDPANRQIFNAVPKILRKQANLQQARIVREMPSSAENIAKKLGLDLKVVEEDIQDLFNKGLVAPTKHGWNMPSSFGFMQDMMGSASPKYVDDELQSLFRELFAELDVRKIQRHEILGEKFVYPPMCRVVPKWRTIKDIPGILTCEDTRQIFKKSQQIVIINCPCKALSERTEECKENVPLESCIVGGSVARYQLKRGTGRELSYDECMEYLDRVDKQQIVQTAGNDNSQNLISYGVCNCHPCCCLYFVRDRFNKSHINPNLSLFAPSRYSAETNPAKCTACRKCIDKRCPFGAITMQYYPEYEGVRAHVNEDKCMGCGLCVLTCPSNAKRMKVVRPPDFIPNFRPPEPGVVNEFINI